MNKVFRPYLRFPTLKKTIYHLGRSIPCREVRRLGIRSYAYDEELVHDKDKALLSKGKKNSKRLTFVYHSHYFNK